MTTAADIFGKIAEADANSGGNFITDGKYLLIIGDAEIKDLDEGWTAITEFLVEESDNVKVDKNMLNDGEEAPEARGVGETVSDVQKLDKFKSAASNVVALVCAAEGVNDKNLTVDQKKVLSSRFFNGEFRGHRIRCETYRKEKRGKKGEFMALRSYRHVENTSEMIADAIARLEGKAPASPADAAPAGDDPLAAAK